MSRPILARLPVLAVVPVLALLAFSACANQAFEEAQASDAPVPYLMDAMDKEAEFGRADRGLAAGEVSEQDARELIRTGSVGLVVDDWAAFRTALDGKLAQDHAFVGDASLSHTEGQVSNGTLTLRVPVALFDDMVTWLQSCAEVRYVEVHSADVTRQYVDLQSRIENGQREADRLRDLLTNRTGDLDDVLAVERELARVQGEVEQAQRDSQAMKEEIDLSTVTVNVEVRSKYTPAVAQGFGEQIKASFVGSLQAMEDVGKGTVIAGVAVAPWLAVGGAALTALLAGLVAGFKRLVRK
jgi:hypothetical protein